MTEKELRKLRRQDLLQLLVLQSKETSELQARVDELAAGYERLKGKLDEKDETIERLKDRLDEKDETIAQLQVELMEHAAAADAAGINVIRYKYVSCILGAAIAGVGGSFYLLDCTRGSLEYVIDAMGWLAVALVIFSLWRSHISIFGSFIFGFLYILPQYITGVGLAEKEILKVIPYAATALVLIVISFFNKKETQPPASLGLPYFREDR
jgi:hypothetical protein